MQEQRALREVTNLPSVSPEKMPACHARLDHPKNVSPLRHFNSMIYNDQNESQVIQNLRPPLQQLLSISTRELDFKQCLPGSIHEKPLFLQILKQLDTSYNLMLSIVCQDEILNDSPELIFGVKQSGQYEYYDDYRIKVKKPKRLQFRIGAKTPLYYHYALEDYAPVIVMLKLVAQLPQLHCPKQLSTSQESNRVIKLSIIQNKSKRECKIPFKMNNNMTFGMSAEIVGLGNEGGLVDIKPKMMTLSGKGQFALILIANSSPQIRESLSKGKTYILRRILTLTIKQTKFIYHFPIQITYYPSTSSQSQSLKNKLQID